MKDKFGFARSPFTALAMAALCSFSLGAKADQEEEFVAALMAQNVDEATRIFEQHHIDPNHRCVHRDARGWTPIFIAACFGRWLLVTRMMEAGGDVNSTPSEGRHRGKTVFGLAIAAQQLPLATQMFERGGDVNAVVIEGPERGMTPLYVAVRRREWSLVARILLMRLEANLRVFPADHPSHTLERLIYGAQTPKWVQTLFELVKYLDPQRGAVIYYAEECARKPFHNAVTAFMDPQKPITTISHFPAEICWDLADKAIYAQLPELNEVPAEFKEPVAKLVRRILVGVQELEAKLNDPVQTDAKILRTGAARIVASRVLQRLYPIETRDQRKLADCPKGERQTLANKKTMVKKIRKWIEELLRRQLSDRILVKEERDRLVDMLSELPLKKITRKWVNRQIFSFFRQEDVPVATVKERHVETKRGHDNEEHDLSKLKIRIKRPKAEAAHDANLREGLIRDIIRDAPILDMAQVRARVDEIMGEGVQPMDTEDENQTHVDESLPRNHLLTLRIVNIPPMLISP